jgi:hypothetical protein
MNRYEKVYVGSRRPGNGIFGNLPALANPGRGSDQKRDFSGLGRAPVLC